MEKKITASNGVDIYYYQQPNIHSVCISLYIKTGTLYENDNAGISHFLEHIHFRKLGGRKQKELYYELESIGAEFGGVTYREFMRFYLSSTPKYFGKLATVAADLLGGIEANAKDFSAEKRIVLSEIREENQKNDVDFFSNQFIWEKTNLSRSVLGTIASIKPMTLDMLITEKERTFTKQNVFYYVTGRFDENDLAVLQEAVERYDLSGRPSINNCNIAPIPFGFQQRDAMVKLSHRSFMMHDVKIAFDVDFKNMRRSELIFLDSILTRGLCSLLRAEMVEKKGLIYEISSVVEQYNNIGVYYFKFTVYKSILYEAVRSFISVIQAAKKGISEMDMGATRVFWTDNQMKLLDDPDDLNWEFAYENHILPNRFEDIDDLSREYAAITSDRLLQMTQEIFQPKNVMLFSLGNKKGLSVKKLHRMLLEL